MNTSNLSSVATQAAGAVDMARARIIAVFGVIVVFTALVVPPILIDTQTHSSLDCDMRNQHLPQINFFIQHPWNFVDYPGYSVSLPGHHILLAWTAKALGYMKIDSTTAPIRLLHATFGLAFSLILFLFLYRLRRDDSDESRLWVTLALWTSVVPSFYFVQSSVFISTDVPAATIYLVFLYLIAFHSQAVAAIATSATALVFWRQNYAPVIAVPLLTSPDRVRANPIGPLLLTVGVPGAILAFYIIQFGGFAPPNSIVEPLPEPLIQIGWNSMGLHLGGVFPQSILHAFAFLGLVTPIYLMIFSTVVQTAYRSSGTIIAAAVIFLLITTIWVAVPSTINFGAGRWGSVVWSLSQIGPSWGDRSLIILLLAVVGAAFMAPLMHLALSRNEIRPILLGMMLYIAGQIFQPLAYQRYVEPVVLISLALIGASSGVVTTWRITLFASIFALYSLAGLLRIYDILPNVWLFATFRSACPA
jgi:hypothetical protein